MTTSFDLSDGSARRRRGALALTAAGLLLLTAACGKKEQPGPTGGGTGASGAARPTATPEGMPTNLTVGKSTIGELTISQVSQDFGKPQLNISINGTPLSVAGKKYTTGIGTHANSRIKISLPSGARTLSGGVGIDDYVENRGTVVFRILDGEKVLFRSNLMKGRMPAQTFDVPVAGLSEVTLVADDGGDGNTSDHSDWVDLAIHK